MDNAIHRINHYPVDSVVCFVNTYPLDSDLSGALSTFEQPGPDVLISWDKKPYSYLTFHNVLVRQGFSNCNRPRLNFQPFALRDMTMTAREGCCVGQKMSYRFSFC